MAVLCPGLEMNSFFLDVDTLRAPNDAGLSFSNFDPPLNHYLSISDTRQTNLDKKPTLYLGDPGMSDGIQYQGHPGDTSMVPFADGSLYPPQKFSTATNVDDMKIHDVFDTSTISPLPTCFDSDTVTSDYYHSNGSFSVDESAYSATHTYSMNREGPVDERGHESIHSRVNFAPRGRGRRRTSDQTESGSARAVYLEKNRQAASKCRAKQKRQHDDLIETVREVERKNKVLKWEVKFLESDLRNLMKIVGKHNECLDGRLRMYVQREANRLSLRVYQSPIAELLSLKGSFDGDSASPENLEAILE